MQDDSPRPDRALSLSDIARIRREIEECPDQDFEPLERRRALLVLEIGAKLVARYGKPVTE